MVRARLAKVLTVLLGVWSCAAYAQRVLVLDVDNTVVEGGVRNNPGGDHFEVNHNFSNAATRDIKYWRPVPGVFMLLKEAIQLKQRHPDFEIYFKGGTVQHIANQKVDGLMAEFKKETGEDFWRYFPRHVEENTDEGGINGKLYGKVTSIPNGNIIAGDDSYTVINVPGNEGVGFVPLPHRNDVGLEGIAEVRELAPGSFKSKPTVEQILKFASQEPMAFLVFLLNKVKDSPHWGSDLNHYLYGIDPDQMARPLHIRDEVFKDFAKSPYAQKYRVEAEAENKKLKEETVRDDNPAAAKAAEMREMRKVLEDLRLAKPEDSDAEVRRKFDEFTGVDNSPAPKPPQSSFEQEVAELRHAGISDKDIADTYGISIGELPPRPKASRAGTGGSGKCSAALGGKAPPPKI